MSVTVGKDGNVSNANWLESKHRDRIGTEEKNGKKAEWSSDPHVDKSGSSKDTPSYTDSSNFHEDTEYGSWAGH